MSPRIARLLRPVLSKKKTGQARKKLKLKKYRGEKHKTHETNAKPKRQKNSEEPATATNHEEQETNAKPTQATRHRAPPTNDDDEATKHEPAEKTTAHAPHQNEKTHEPTYETAPKTPSKKTRGRPAQQGTDPARKNKQQEPRKTPPSKNAPKKKPAQAGDFHTARRGRLSMPLAP